MEVQGGYLAERLEGMKRKYACVGDVRYKGLFSVIELVRDKDTKEPLAPFNGTSPEMGILTAHLKSKYLYTFAQLQHAVGVSAADHFARRTQHGLDIIEEALQLVDAELLSPREPILES